tara:strand:+ start:101 stop:259 length:159 start_codon:yes stop_codon:yes gene_type:complete
MTRSNSQIKRKWGRKKAKRRLFKNKSIILAKKVTPKKVKSPAVQYNVLFLET